MANDKDDTTSSAGDDDENLEWRFNSERLDWNIVARPLLDQMASQRKSQDPEKPIPVVIDLNFKFKWGLAAAKNRTVELITETAMEMGLPGNPEGIDRVDERKRSLSQQYLFADLEPSLIENVAAKSFYTGLESAGTQATENKFILRPLFMIWPDFIVSARTVKSVSTVKADAALRSFSADGEGIVWAVLDSGIEGRHPHFELHENLILTDLDPPLRHYDFTKIYPHGYQFADDLKKAEAAEEEERKAALTDEYGHGTHVAGIIAGQLSNEDAKEANRVKVTTRHKDETGATRSKEFTLRHIQGMAPKTKLVSFKVLNDNGKAPVSNLLAAIAKIQEINEYGRWLKIHGVNLSVGYDFEPEWFACGQSPLCLEVDRLVKSGVVVVAAAGNTGYGYKQTQARGPVASGMMMSVNDPGNAELAITVGSTHREMPHIYGVSYFSSKGPTGDGRRKPDLVAPGERIISCATSKLATSVAKDPKNPPNYKEDSGTSMAAPHVSGVIAAFLSIRREFRGQPEKVKEIFVSSATDLKRESYMQGSGLVDLMRAIQSI